MSTRCQIQFEHTYSWKEDGETISRTDKRMVYRHSDGYPEGVIPDLLAFHLWNLGRNGDIEYTVANFIYWSKRSMDDSYLKYYAEKPQYKELDGEREKWNDLGRTNASHQHIGFGVGAPDEFHGDIDYFYEVVLDEDVVKIRTYEVPYPFKSKKDFELLSEKVIDVKKEQARLHPTAKLQGGAK